MDVLSGRVPVGFLGLAVIGFVAFRSGTKSDLFDRLLIWVNGDTGAVVWKTTGLRGPKRPMDTFNSQATPTAVIGLERVYGYFGGAGVMCSDLEGRLLWTMTNIPPESVYGAGWSPVLCESNLVLSCISTGKASLIGVDARRGEWMWTLDFPSGKAPEFRTSAVIEVDGRKYLMAWVKQRLLILDPRTGKTLAEYATKWPLGAEAATTPVYDGEVVYLASQSSVHALRLRPLLAGQKSESWSVDLAGRGPVSCSPVVCGSRLFMISDRGYATLLELTDGQRRGRKQLAGRYLASPIVVGHRVYVFNSEGRASVLDCRDDIREIVRNSLGEPVTATPAPVGGRLFVRTHRQLWCIENEEGGPED